jgi:hypothetical protein
LRHACLLPKTLLFNCSVNGSFPFFANGFLSLSSYSPPKLFFFFLLPCKMSDDSSSDGSHHVICDVCCCHFTILSNHLRLSPRCSVAAIAVGNNSGSSTLLHPCPSPPPLPDDLLDIPGQEEPGHFSAGTDPRSPPQGIDADYDDDDFEMWHNTEMFHVAEPESATSPTQTTVLPSPANGALLTLAMGDPPLANDTPVPSHPRLPNASLESGQEFTVPPDFVKSDHCLTSADRSVMRPCDTCDKAGSRRCLMDRLFAQLKTEIARNAFDPLHFSITKRCFHGKDASEVP